MIKRKLIPLLLIAFCYLQGVYAQNEGQEVVEIHYHSDSCCHQVKEVKNEYTDVSLMEKCIERAKRGSKNKNILKNLTEKERNISIAFCLFSNGPFFIYDFLKLFYNPFKKEICNRCTLIIDRNTRDGKECTQCPKCDTPLSNWTCSVCLQNLDDCTEAIACKSESIEDNKHYICMDCFKALPKKKCPLCRHKMNEENFKFKKDVNCLRIIIRILFYTIPWLFMSGFSSLVSENLSQGLIYYTMAQACTITGILVFIALKG